MSKAQPPIENIELEKTETADYAVGAKGVLVAMQHIMKAMPVGRAVKILNNLNQKNGVDCPSCAWPDPDGERSKLGEYCENGAKAIADEATIRRISLPFFQKYAVNELAGKTDYWLGQQGRLTGPMVLLPGETHYKSISWQNSFQIIANELNQLQSPDEAIFYTSGRSSNEAAYLYQLLVRAFGTNNLPDCSNMCHESSGVALTQTIGIGKGTVTLADFDKAELIIIMGQNPGTNHPRMLTSLEKAKENGAKIVSINPLYEAGLLAYKNPQRVKGYLGTATKLTDLYLPIRINGDLALFKILIKLLLEKAENTPEVIDQQFITDKTEHFEILTNYLKSINIDELVADTGLKIEAICELAEMLISRKKIIICWAMGLTQHKNAVGTIRELVNLLLLKGAIGIEGAGLCPVRGHSNVQGDRTVGIMHKPSAKLTEALEKRYKIKAPTKNGLDVVEAIEAMYHKKASVFIALGGNFLSASPDTEYTAKAIQNCKLTVHISTKLNRSHLITGNTALILPCLGRTDIDTQETGLQYLSTENSMGVVQKTQGVLAPVSANLMSEPAIVASIAEALLGNKYNIPWSSFAKNYSLIRAEIEAVIEGFENYDKRLKQDGGFYLANGPRQGIFKTATGRAQFTINKWTKVKVAEGAFLMMTIRSHDQFNTTVYGLNDRYRGVFKERRVVFMNEEDMTEYGFKAYEIVNLINKDGGQYRLAEKFVLVPYKIPKGCIATYFPEANVLIPINSTADESGTPTSKSVEVYVEKI